MGGVALQPVGQRLLRRVNEEDTESRRPWAEGFVVREASRIASNWRSTETLDSYLKRHKIVGIEHLDAVVVDPPSPADRVRIQYAENEDREEFSDMERAWALLQMKQAMSEAPWEEVEARIRAKLGL